MTLFLLFPHLPNPTGMRKLEEKSMAKIWNILGVLLVLLAIQSCGGKKYAWPSDRDAEQLGSDVTALNQTYYIFLQDRKIAMSGEEKKFNADGFIEEEKRYGRERTFLSRIAYTYTPEGAASATMYTDQGAVFMTIEISYDPATKVRTQLNKNSQGQLASKVVTQCDDQWRGLSEVTYSGSGESLQIVKNTYDANGHVAKSEILEGDGALETEQIFTYNDKGLPATAKTVDVHTGEYNNSFSYTFDKKGNWIQKQTMLNGQLVEQVEREIIYQ